MKPKHPPELITPESPKRPEFRSATWEFRSSAAGEPPNLRQIELLAHLMDSVFEIPGLRLRFGLDALLGLIPGLGDTATSIVSLYILHAASRHGVSRITMTRMATNVAIDYAIGAIPFAGDVFDVYWKSNRKNAELLRRELEANPTGPRPRRVGDWLFFLGLAGVLLALLVGSITIAWFVIRGLGSLLFPAA